MGPIKIELQIEQTTNIYTNLQSMLMQILDDNIYRSGLVLEEKLIILKSIEDIIRYRISRGAV